MELSLVSCRVGNLGGYSYCMRVYGFLEVTEHFGLFYPGENIETDKSGCSGIVCIGGEIANWDNWCALYSSTPSTTTPPPTTPTPPRTTIPAGSCFYNNAWHADGKIGITWRSIDLFIYNAILGSPDKLMTEFWS